MKIVTTFHPSSSVLASFKCQLSVRDVEHLVVAKINRIDVYAILPEGLVHYCGVDIWGKVLTIRPIPIPGSYKSKVLVMLDHPDPELIFLTLIESDLKAEKQLSLYERIPRAAEYLNDVIVHPSGKVAIASCYTGKLKVILIEDGRYKSDFDLSVPELTLLSFAFLADEDEYLLIVLHLDFQQRMQLLCRAVQTDDLEQSSNVSPRLAGTSISHKLLPLTESLPIIIPVDGIGDVDDESSFPGGVLLAGGRKLLFYGLASSDSQAKQRGKKRRLEEKKRSTDPAVSSQAKEKEKEREARKRKANMSIDWPWSEVAAWCAVDQSSRKYLLGDTFGKLALLSLNAPGDNEMVLVPLGETSPSTTLTYLTSQILYIGSHLGNSQLIQIHPTPVSLLDLPTLPIPPEIATVSPSSLVLPSKRTNEASETKEIKGHVINTQGSYLSVVKVFKNIAPIVDALVVDLDGSGQVVTCSGGRNTGSLNVVRTGADFEELADIAGMVNVTSIWPIRELFDDITHTHLLVSSLRDSHIFRLNNGSSMSRMNSTSKGFITNSPTLALSNMAKRVQNAGVSSYLNSSFVVQVTPKKVLLLEYDIALSEYTQLNAGWTPNGNNHGPTREIVAASVNSSQVVLALSGARLVVLNLDDQNQFREVGHKDVANEVAALTCTPLDTSKRFSKYITISYWRTNRVEIISISASGLVSVCTTPSLPSLPRSLLLYNFGLDPSPKGADHRPYLLAGLVDGTLVSFAFKDNQLLDQKATSLGHSPVTMSSCEVDGKKAVFASGSRVSILHWDKRRLTHSPILLKDVVAVSRLNTSHHKSSLILATSTGLSIGKIKDLDKMHIQSIPFGLDNPRRIVHQPLLKVFGVATTRTEPVRVGESESFRSSFRLIDDSSLQFLGQFDCEPDEEITAVETVTFVARSFFCVGTVFYRPDEKEPTEGRLLIFGVDGREESRDRNFELSLVTSAAAAGCVYALTVVDGMIAAAVNSAVVIFRLDASSVDGPTLQKVTEWNHNYFVTSLVSYGNNLVVGDGISSVSLLKFADSRLQTVARDYGPLWPISLQAVDEQSIIGANTDLNLFTFTLQRTPLRKILERDGNYHLGDLVSKFIRGSLTLPDVSHESFQPIHLFFTSSGHIGVVIDVTDANLSLHLTSLQRNLTYVCKGIGGVSHAKYRAPRNLRGRSDAEETSYGFLDGDFIEQFLTTTHTDKIMAGKSDAERLILSVDQTQKLLEILQSLH